MHRNLLLPICLLALLLGCEPSPEPEGSDLCSTAEPTGSAVTGTLYFDDDASDASTYAGGFSDGDEALGGGQLYLHSDSGSTEAGSCADGSYAFSDLADGTYAVEVVPPEGSVCAMRNCTNRLPRAIEEGSVTIVTFGDSVPRVGDDVLFPERLALLLDDLVEVDNRNVAVEGTVSPQWLPGTTNFENRLAPELDDADVILISLGGNDLLGSLDAGALSDPEGALEDAQDLLMDVAENVLEIVAAIREHNDDVDIVYALYVDYGQAQVFPWNLISGMVGEEAIGGLLASARAGMPQESGILVADLFGASHELEDSLDDYLADSLHFNDRGQTFYAEEIFKTLGGVQLGDSPLSGDPRSPLGLRQDFSFVR